jgi:hypothetical protein
MKQDYLRVSLRLLSVLAIGTVMVRELIWAVTLYREGIVFLIPVAVFLPTIMVVLFLSKMWEPENLASYSPRYRTLRSDLIKCIALSFAAVARLALFQQQ